MEDNWVKIHSSSLNYEAAIIAASLEENNIATIVLDKSDSSYGFGQTEVYVDEKNVLQAKHIIETTAN